MKARPLPPKGEGWREETRWVREFECACGYMGVEYHNEGRENSLICTKCFNGRRADDGPAGGGG